MTEVLAPADLMALCLEPNWADADPDNRRVLVVDLREPGSPSTAELETLSRWVAAQAVPVVGLGGASSPLGRLMDLVVDSERDLDRAVRNIHANPQAASVLVQVLRCTLTLGVLEALTLESFAYATLQAGSEFDRWLSGRTPGTRADADPGTEVLLVSRDGDRLKIVLNDPDSRNALSVAMRDALADAFKLVAMDNTIHTVDVSANGPCFSSGGELAEFGFVADPAEAHRVRMLRMPARYLATHATRYAVHVHRACIGAGIELPAFAARLTASANTFFQLPELAMGLIPGAGGCVSIPRRIGRQRTAYMAILGVRVKADLALEWGLIDAIVD